jgi:hypothetical protein
LASWCFPSRSACFFFVLAFAGCICSKHAYPGTSWTALTLEESWQIADGGDLRTARAQVTSVGDDRVRFVVEL